MAAEYDQEISSAEKVCPIFFAQMLHCSSLWVANMFSWKSHLILFSMRHLESSTKCLTVRCDKLYVNDHPHSLSSNPHWHRRCSSFVEQRSASEGGCIWVCKVFRRNCSFYSAFEKYSQDQFTPATIEGSADQVSSLPSFFSHVIVGAHHRARTPTRWTLPRSTRKAFVQIRSSPKGIFSHSPNSIIRIFFSNSHYIHADIDKTVRFCNFVGNIRCARSRCGRVQGASSCRLRSCCKRVHERPLPSGH